jgi:hypothetical protein
MDQEEAEAWSNGGMEALERLWNERDEKEEVQP